MNFWKTPTTLVMAIVAGIGCFCPAARADNYPSRTPFPPGGPSDVVARIIADGMSRVLNQTIIIENVGGAGGTIGTARAAAATPDGYTLLAAGMGSHVAAPALTPNLRYDSAKDFEPIGLISNAPVAVVARKNFPAKDIKEFIAYLKEHGDGVKQAHGGIGSASHMACLLFTSELGLKPKLIPYRGTGPALSDLIGDHVDFFCEQVVSVAPAVFAPKGTPKDVVAKLSDALDKALDDPAVAKRLVDLGGSLPLKADRGPAPLAQVLKADIARWDPVLRAAMPAPK